MASMYDGEYNNFLSIYQFLSFFGRPSANCRLRFSFWEKWLNEIRKCYGTLKNIQKLGQGLGDWWRFGGSMIGHDQ